MIRAVIFDLYGTLIELERVTGPYLQFARWANVEDPWELVRRSLVLNTRDFRDLADQLGISLSQRRLSALDDQLRRDLESSRIYDDAIDAIETLRQSGLTLGLISNIASPYKEPYYRLELNAYFQTSVFSCDVGIAKPEPEIYRQTARALGLRPRQIVMVGDSRGSDYDGPKAVGMHAVLLQRQNGKPGYRSIASLKELSGILLASN